VKPIFFDLETQNLAGEVGGWSNVEALKLSVACTYHEDHGYQDWWEAQAGDLLAELREAQLIVGFNLNNFDYRVLSLYGSTEGFSAKTFDILDEIFAQLGRRVSLNTLAVMNLGEAKVFESGVQAVRLWRADKLQELTEYCRRDVELTKRLFELWQNAGILWVPGSHYAAWPGLRPVGKLEGSKVGKLEGSR
jgi:DEAD/DEAH box helicase domain-containing protein